MDFRKIAPCDLVNPGVRREFIARHIARELLLLADGCELKSAVAETSQLVCYVYNRCRAWFGMDGDFQKFAEEWRENRAMLEQHSEIDALAEKVCEELKKEQ